MKNKTLKIYKLMLLSFVLFLVVTCKHATVKSTPIEKNYCNVECPAISVFEVYAPRREVKLDKFLICDHEVTQGEWELIMGNVNDFVTSDKGGKGTNYPMNNIS